MRKVRSDIFRCAVCLEVLKGSPDVQRMTGDEYSSILILIPVLILVLILTLIQTAFEVREESSLRVRMYFPDKANLDVMLDCVNFPIIYSRLGT